MGKILTLLLAIFFIQACGKPKCSNENPIFEKFSYQSKEYKSELIKLIKVNQPRFWLNSYFENDQGRFIIVDVHGKNFCAKTELKIIDSDDNIDGIIKTKGISYKGAELSGLKFEAVQNSSSVEFIYKGMGYIID